MHVQSCCFAKSKPKKLIWNEKDSVKYGDFPDQGQSFLIFVARAIVANYPRHKNKLRHQWTGLAAN